jgi:hypothetical protein
VDDPIGRQSETGGDFGVTGIAASKGGTRRLQLGRPGGAVDSAVDSAPSGQSDVRRIHDGVDLLSSDVTQDGFDRRRAHGHSVARATRAVLEIWSL